MKAIFIVILVSILIQEYAAADLQNIQSPKPVNIDLSTLSEATAVVTNGDIQVDEHKLGGYRPLYPPYFLRETPGPAASHPQKTYYDKEYYTRGAQLGGFDDRLDRFLRIRPSPVPLLATVPTTVATVLRQNYARGFANYHVKTEFSKSASWNVKSSYSYRSFRFPAA